MVAYSFIISFPHGNLFIQGLILPGYYFIQYFICLDLYFNSHFIPHGNFIILTWFCFILPSIHFTKYFILVGLYFNSGTVFRVQGTCPNMGIVTILHKNSNTMGEIWKIDDWCDVEGYCCQGLVCISKYGNTNISR